MHDLPLLIREHIEKAYADERGRSAHLLVNDGPLRQTIIALTAGSSLDEHEAPAAASLQVLYGSVCVTSADGEEMKVSLGQLEAIPQKRHSLTATDDAVVLLTAVTET
ncbi:LuxR family transcriptional regulator [Phytomonospora sp. NPDC050363]|uniref:LuxR family transcriptional regulator n=1 Tax=Phytomonospora sp. NPDC050363 TaxID=3155642 RepID=UPI003403C7EA